MLRTFISGQRPQTFVENTFQHINKGAAHRNINLYFIFKIFRLSNLVLIVEKSQFDYQTEPMYHQSYLIHLQ